MSSFPGSCLPCLASAQAGSSRLGRDQVAHPGLWVAACRLPELTGDATPALPAPRRSLLRAVTCQAVTKYVPFPSLAGPIARRPPQASGLPLGRLPAPVSWASPRAASPARCPSGKVGCPGVPCRETLVPSGVLPCLLPPCTGHPIVRYAPSLCPPAFARSGAA